MTQTAPVQYRAVWLLAATFLVAIASLIYELIAATLSSYLLGDSIRQFSFVIGVFLFTMGIGAWLSRFVHLTAPGFIWAQVAIGLIGGMQAPVLFLVYAYLGDIGALLYLILGSIGVLSGMEIPLLVRLLKEIETEKFHFENVLSVDYVGALVASLAFPIIVIPHLGLMSASLAFGALNLIVAGLSIWLFRDRVGRTLCVTWAIALAATVLALFNAERLISVVDAAMFEDDLVLSEQTPYQNISVTRFGDRTRLFLDHSIQFDTLDEHRYHETLVHPAMSLAARARNILILGGGDGMAAREVLKHPEVETLTLVDLDPRVTELFRDHPELYELNAGALRDTRTRIVNQDAWQFVQQSTTVFDVIIIDLPDPKSLSLSKLYSKEFYGLVIERLSPYGALVTQAGSPVFARNAFWSIVMTLENTRNPMYYDDELSVLPYHTYVPSFGDWGFALATPQQVSERPMVLPHSTKFLTEDIWKKSKVFAKDSARTDVEVNSIQSHALLGYYQAGWDHWFR